MPWYAALLIAVTATAIGYGIDAGQKELTHVFAGFYIAGCVAAVLAVRQDGIFTTIIQPPLILFGAVPGAYWLFHDAKVGRLKDLLINCGYPLIERFPLMLGTAGVVLAIGLARWYFGNAYPTSTTPPATQDAAGGGVAVKSFFNGIVAKAQSALQSDADADDTAHADDTTDSRRGRTSGASSRTRRTTRTTRSTTRSARTRSRHSRDALDDGSEPAQRPRRSTRSRASSRDHDAVDPARRSRRRPRPDVDPDARGQSPREPRTRRSPYERPTPRSSRFDGFESYRDRYEPPGGPNSGGRHESRDPYEASYEPRRRRSPSNGSGGTHHPISQVRYRGGSQEPPREPQTERRTRSRTPGQWPAESWEYDV